jgi:excinuclease UvrABC ATPase subunit
VVAEGPPEAVAQATASYTGKYLRELLPRHATGSAAGSK